MNLNPKIQLPDNFAEICIWLGITVTQAAEELIACAISRAQQT